jgi:hypothetical protein
VQDQTARHYLRIYRLRLRMAESGTTRPSASALEFFRTFVAALETLDDDAPVRLDTTQGLVRLTDARSGSLLAELKIGDEHQQDALMP